MSSRFCSGVYYQIKKKDPLFPRIDEKIKELEGELHPRPAAISLPGSKKAYRRPSTSPVLVAIIGAIATILAALISSPLIKEWLSPVHVTPTATTTPLIILSLTPTHTFTPLSPTAMDTPTSTITPTNTLTLTPKPTSTISPTKTPTPIVIFDGGIPMVLVPAGFFQMHGEQGSVKTYVNSFYIDQHEVTNAQYELCVGAGVCIPPYTDVDPQFDNVLHYGDQAYSNFPVVLVSWNMVYTYCAWRGQGVRLPTTSEWEKAARGLLVEQHYPWGDAAPVCSEGSINGANFLGCNSNDAFPVQSFAPNGYGIYDMSGNVAEWVGGIPTFENSGGLFILGGSWRNSSDAIFVYSKVDGVQRTGYVDVGFRCAKSVP